MLEIFGFNAFSMSLEKPRLMLILMLTTQFNAFFVFGLMLFFSGITTLKNPQADQHWGAE